MLLYIKYFKSEKQELGRLDMTMKYIKIMKGIYLRIEFNHIILIKCDKLFTS